MYELAVSKIIWHHKTLEYKISHSNANHSMHSMGKASLDRGNLSNGSLQLEAITGYRKDGGRVYKDGSTGSRERGVCKFLYNAISFYCILYAIYRTEFIVPLISYFAETLT